MRSLATTTTATDTFMQHECTFNISTATATNTSCKGIHLNHSRDTNACKPGHPTCSGETSDQQRRVQLASFLVVDDQQAGPSRPLTFTLTPTKHVNPPSVASATGEESQHNISGLSSFFENLQSVMSYQQIDTPQQFSSADTPSPAASPPFQDHCCEQIKGPFQDHQNLSKTINFLFIYLFIHTQRYTLNIYIVTIV